jgi:anti-anti-sigma factor
VQYIDSSGIGLLMNFARKIRGYGGGIVLFNYDNDLKELLEIANITDNIICRGGFEDAADALSRQRKE